MSDSDRIKWNVKPSHETSQGRVDRIAIYLQSKVLEIIDSNNSVFYLVYFKNTVIGGGQVGEVKQGTFLYKVFEQGIVLDTTHPLFPVLLPKNRNVHIPAVNEVFTHLQNQLSLPEVAVAATYMDNFIEQHQLVSIIRQIFDHFKRNGQFLNAYHIAKILLHFSPDIKAIQEIIRTWEFEKHRKADEANTEAFLQQAPLLMEPFCYQNRSERKYEINLHQLLMQQSRPVERLLLFMNLFELKHDFYDYDEFIGLLQQVLTPDEQYQVLTFLCESSPAYPPLTDRLLQEQIRLQRYPEALALILNHIPSPSPAHYKIIEAVIDHVDASFLLTLTGINEMLGGLYPANPGNKESLIRRVVTSLLHQLDINEVQAWLEPIKEISPDLPIFAELKQIQTLSNDLDNLMKLGELYYQFGLLDKSIECFTWEMELSPTALEPIRWLSKVYQEKGMKEESESYKNLSIHMAKRA
jgi:tetratricopeptide (TPR) repeat protein